MGIHLGLKPIIKFEAHKMGQFGSICVYGYSIEQQK
jgi:hypothetical protein